MPAIRVVPYVPQQFRFAGAGGYDEIFSNERNDDFPRFFSLQRIQFFQSLLVDNANILPVPLVNYYLLAPVVQKPRRMHPLSFLVRKIIFSENVSESAFEFFVRPAVRTRIFSRFAQ